MYFGNRNIRTHLLKGVLGFTTLYLTLSTIQHTIWPALVLLPLTLYLLRGCPICWTLGLIETIVMAIHRRSEQKFASAGERSIDTPEQLR